MAGMRLENLCIASNFEVMEAGIDIPFDSTWISNLSTNQRIGIRRITVDIDVNGRRLENVYIASNVEATEAGVNIPFDSTWISNLSSNKRIGIRGIAVNIDANRGYPFRVGVNRNVLQGGMMYIDSTYIDINVTSKECRISDR
jgi:hypothetical protein